jgi:hypothetical protein
VRGIFIYTATQRYSLGEVEAIDLLLHVRRDGGEHRMAAARPLIAAIDGTSTEIRWSEEAKGSVLGALNAWLTSDGSGHIPEVVHSLRAELIRDLRIAPFEDDAPTTG